MQKIKQNIIKLHFLRGQGGEDGQLLITKFQILLCLRMLMPNFLTLSATVYSSKLGKWPQMPPMTVVSASFLWYPVCLLSSIFSALLWCFFHLLAFPLFCFFLFPGTNSWTLLQSNLPPRSFPQHLLWND